MSTGAAISDDDTWLGPAGFVFQTPVRAKKGKPTKAGGRPAGGRSAALRQIAAVTARKPEVMVKVTGSARGRTGIREHLAYISRNGKLLAETSEGELIQGSEEMTILAREWWAASGQNRPSSARDTYNLVLSMPVGTDPEKVRDAARVFAREEFGGKHEYVFVLHTEDSDPHKNPAPQPHVHLTVRTLGLQGQYLNPKKADLQAWRERFAEQLRGRGVEAEATPRRARGVVQTNRGRKTEHMGSRSRINRWNVEQAIKSLQTGDKAAGNEGAPWVEAGRKRRTDIRKAWGTIATALDGQGEVALAVQVRAFLETMPPERYKQDELIDTAATHHAAMLAKASKALEPSEQDRGRKR